MHHKAYCASIWAFQRSEGIIVRASKLMLCGCVLGVAFFDAHAQSGPAPIPTLESVTPMGILTQDPQDNPPTAKPATK